MDKTKRLIISGKVQGVSFRDFVERKARELKVRGWVRNLRDGNVEALVQGSEQAVDALIEWTRQGPSLARVDHIEISDAEGDFAQFTTRY